MQMIFYFPISILISVLSYLAKGYVLMKLWLWFIVPTFHVQAINYAEAAGISLVVSFLTYQYIDNQDDENIWFNLFKSLIISLVFYVVILIIGFFLKGYL